MKYPSAPDVSSARRSDGLGSLELQAQLRRRTRLLELHRDATFELFGDDGRFLPWPNFDWRGYFWHAAAFLASDAGSHRKANALLSIAGREGDGHFWTSAATVLLARFGLGSAEPRIEPEVDRALRQRLSTMVEGEAAQRPRGYNDNYPAMAALAACVGGPLTGRRDTLAGGKECLRAFEALYRRRGFLSEYVSPTYSPITLAMFAEIVNHCEDDEARNLAMQIEQRLWMELAVRWHRPTSSLSGPHSRAYMADMCAHHHTAHLVFYLAFGEEVAPINATNAQYPPVPGQARHNGGPDVGFHATVVYHPPAWAYEVAADKPLPAVVEGSAEVAAFARNIWSDQRHPETPFCEVPAAPVHAYTYLTADYALGTSSRPWLDGKQHTGFHVVYRRRGRVEGPRDVGTVFARYLFGGEEQIDRDRHLDCQGRMLGLQHESSSMVLYWPRPVWGASRGVPDPERTPVRAAHLSLLLPDFWQEQAEVWLGTSRVDGWGGSSAEPAPIYVHVGRIFLAIHPLAVTDLGRAAAIRLQVCNGYRVINLINYEGEPRTFPAADLPAIRNGFVCEVASVNDGLDFAGFRRLHASPRIEDRWHTVDAMRTVRYGRQGLELAMEISPYSEGIKCRTVNGRLREEPRFQMTGLDASRLPFW